MTDDLNNWLEGAPVIPMPGGEQFAVWLDGAPVVSMGGDPATAVVTGTEIITETGTVTASGGAVATVAGSECITETGTCSVIGKIPVTGEECATETGTVTATGGAVAQVEGSECQTETGIVSVTIIGPTPPPPVQTGSAGKIHTRRLHSWDFPPRNKNRPEKYRRRRKTVETDDFTVEIPEIPIVLPDVIHSTVIALVQGSECSVKTGICNVKVDHPDDEETIKLILEAMEIADSLPDEGNSSQSLGNRRQSEVMDTDSEDLELILMISEMV